MTTTDWRMTMGAGRVHQKIAAEQIAPPSIALPRPPPAYFAGTPPTPRNPNQIIEINLPIAPPLRTYRSAKSLNGLGVLVFGEQR